MNRREATALLRTIVQHAPLTVSELDMLRAAASDCSGWRPVLRPPNAL